MASLKLELQVVVSHLDMRTGNQTQILCKMTVLTYLLSHLFSQRKLSSHVLDLLRVCMAQARLSGASGDLLVSLCLERYMFTVEPGETQGFRSPPNCLFYGIPSILLNTWSHPVMVLS